MRLVIVPISSFLIGAIMSGLLTVGGARAGIKSVYALALSVEVMLIGIFMFLRTSMNAIVPSAAFFGMVSVAAMSMGLQNATITQIAGAVVRTTHVTGVLTDLGLESVQFLFWFHDRTRGRFHDRLGRAFRLSRRHPSLQRLLLLASIWSSFVAGAVLGALMQHRWGLACLLAPIMFLVFMITVDMIRPIADLTEVDAQRYDHELDRFGIDPGLVPDSVGVYRIRGRGLLRRTAPDLGRLSERVSESHLVVMLILGDDIDIDENNLAGLQSSLAQLRSRHRELVVCITDSNLYMRVNAAPIGDELGAANVCSDPEFAVARAIELSLLQKYDNMTRQRVASAAL